MGPRITSFAGCFGLALACASGLLAAQGAIRPQLRVHVRVSEGEFEALQARVRAFCQQRGLDARRDIELIGWGLRGAARLPARRFWDLALGYPQAELERRRDELLPESAAPGAVESAPLPGVLVRALPYAPVRGEDGAVLGWDELSEHTATTWFVPDPAREPEFAVVLAQIARSHLAALVPRIEARLTGHRLLGSPEIRALLARHRRGIGFALLRAGELPPLGRLPAARHYAVISRLCTAPDLARDLRTQLLAGSPPDWIEFGLPAGSPALARLLPAPSADELEAARRDPAPPATESMPIGVALETGLLLLFGLLFAWLLLRTARRVSR